MLKTKKGLFILESPLQVMCAYEAIKELDVKKVRIIARLADRGGRNNEQMLLILKEFLSDYYVKKVYLKPQDRSLKSITVTIRFILEILFLYSLKYNIFIGYFDSKFVKLLTFFVKDSRKIYLDDGTASLSYPESIRKSKSVIFSMFDFSVPFFIKNKFSHLSSHLFAVNKIKRKEVIVFIGSPIREIDGCDTNEYFKIILKIKKMYHNIDLLYFPHRRELKEDLDKIDSFNINVVPNSFPIEMFYVEFPSYHPKIIASIFSTAMFTMSLIYDSSVVLCSGIVTKENKALNKILKEVKKIEGMKNIFK